MFKCRIIKLKVYSELTLLEAFVDKLNVSDSDGSESDDSEGSDSECGGLASEGSDSGHGIPASYDSSDSRDLSLRFSAFGLYAISIEELSCQHRT